MIREISLDDINDMIVDIKDLSRIKHDVKIVRSHYEIEFRSLFHPDGLEELGEFYKLLNIFINRIKNQYNVNTRLDNKGDECKLSIFLKDDTII